MPVIGEKSTLCIERILFATDFSDTSNIAEAYARALAHRFGSTVDIVHIYDPTRNLTYEEGVLAPLDSQRMLMRQRKLSTIESKLKHDRIKAKSILLEGHPASRELLNLVDEMAVDLVLLGTHSKSGLTRFVIGSTAEEVIRTVKRPVLTVGPHAKRPRQGSLVFTNIVYATDFSVQAAKAAAFALSFAQDSGAHLYFCHIVNLPTKLSHFQEDIDGAFLAELKRMVPETSYDWCCPEAVVEHGHAAVGILELAKKVDADLIVLGPRKSTFMLTHLERGVTVDVLAQAECPVLTVS